MGTGRHLDQEARELLLAGARALVTQDANFIIKTLLTDTGISRAQFRRCFAGKQQLLAALTQSDVEALDEILETAQSAAVEQTLRAAVGSDIVHFQQLAAPETHASQTAAQTSGPQTDAWLERRLRVFERALAAMEKRHEKLEQSLAQHIALTEERFGTLSAAQEIAARAMPEQAQSTPAPEAESNPRLKPEPKPQPEAVAQIIAAPSPVAETIAALQAALLPEFAQLAEAEETVSVTPSVPPVSEKEMADFVAHARQAARNAASTPPQSRRRPTPWLAWAGVALTFVLLCAGMLFASGVLGRPAGAMPISGVIHRQIAQNGTARIIALADNGNAGAQTLLALDYLHGQGVAADQAAALRWSRAAASQGEPMAQYLLGALEYDHDAGDAVRWFRAAADQGNVKAMHNLAIAYAQGVGATADPAAAVQWFTRAAEQGYRDSEFDLAVLYERGAGVPQNGAAALKWYLIAASHGDAPSAARAGILRDQLPPADVQAATHAASAFVAQRSASLANEAPTL